MLIKACRRREEKRKGGREGERERRTAGVRNSEADGGSRPADGKLQHEQ